MKIGITERGDPSIDFSWVEKIDDMDAVVFITKKLTDKVISCFNENIQKVIFHISCTGYGGNFLIEPNIPEPEKQLNQALKLIKLGVPLNHIVIRIDPIIPTQKGLKVAESVFEKAYSLGFKRFRVSIFDAYPHVRERFRELKIQPPYYDGFSAPQFMFENADKLFLNMIKNHPDIQIETCAEPNLKVPKHTGCVNKEDMEMLGLDTSSLDSEGYQRKECLCCSAKTELLKEKSQCPYKCLYCYWK